MKSSTFLQVYNDNNFVIICAFTVLMFALTEEKLLANRGLVFAERGRKQGTKEQRPTGTSGDFMQTESKHQISHVLLTILVISYFPTLVAVTV